MRLCGTIWTFLQMIIHDLDVYRASLELRGRPSKIARVSDRHCTYYVKRNAVVEQRLRKTVVLAHGFRQNGNSKPICVRNCGYANGEPVRCGTGMATPRGLRMSATCSLKRHSTPR